MAYKLLGKTVWALMRWYAGRRAARAVRDRRKVAGAVAVGAIGATAVAAARGSAAAR